MSSKQPKGAEAIEQYASLIEDFSPEEDEVEVKNFPRLNEAALYGVASEFVKFATKDSEADPVAVLVTFLTFAGAAFGTCRFALVGPEKHHPRLFSAIVGSSSKARKGTSMGPVSYLFKNVFRLFPELEFKIKPGPLSSGEGLIYQVRDAREEKDKDGNLLDEGVEDKRLLVTESEFSAALKASRRENNTLSPIVRCLWDHGNVAPIIKKDPIGTTGAHVCVVGHITREELGLLLHESDVYNGFANRFLWVCARRTKKIPRPPSLDEQTCEIFAKKLATSIETANFKAQNGAKVVGFDTRAASLWDKLYYELSVDRSGVYGVVTARAEPQVLRLALIYCLLDAEDEIREKHINAAIALWNYCDESALYLFGNSNRQDSISRKILDFLQSGLKSQTEINKYLGGKVSAMRLSSSLAELQALGSIFQTTDASGQGRKKTIWQLTTN